jgi:ABC-type uncharacterized transport system substrate-binding protein
MDRRDLMVLASIGAYALAAPRAGRAQTTLDSVENHIFAFSLNPAQTAGRTYRIGMLVFGTAPSGANPDPAGFQQGLRELGYVEGHNVVIERRYADGRPDRLAALAAELVQLKVDVILAGGPATREAASKATSTIPIVTVSGSDRSAKAGPKASLTLAATSQA